MLYAIGVFIALFLTVLIFSKKEKSRADVILGCWTFIIAMQVWGYYCYVSGLIYMYPALTWLNLPYAFLHGPMLFLYTRSLTNPEKSTSWNWLWHFVLPFLMTVSMLPVLLMPEMERLRYYRTNGASYTGFQLDINLFLSISGIFYIVATGVLLYHHKRRIRDEFSNQEKVNLNWLRLLLVGMVLTWVVIIVVRQDQWIFSTSALLLIFIGYFGIRQVGIFTDTGQPGQQQQLALGMESERSIGSIGQKRKYHKSGLTEDAAVALYGQLQNLMISERLFTEPELTLTDLAKRLQVHPNYLSQVINNTEAMNFYNYVNGLRVEEFKKRMALPENQKFTLLSIAYECGFNSKTAFNRFFKKATGLSPSDYLKTTFPYPGDPLTGKDADH